MASGRCLTDRTPGSAAEGREAVRRKSVVRRARRSLLVLVRALHPHERLYVYHVPRSKVTLFAPDCFRKLKQARVSLPRRPRLVLEVEPVLARRRAGDVR